MTGARDLLGYGGRPPQAAWPNGAAVAVSLVVNYEEGAELSVEDGDTTNERIGEIISVVEPGRRDLGQEQAFSYGTRAGLWRFLDAFDRHARKVTFYMCGRAVERTPELAAEIVRRGHEPACHGWRWTPHATFEDREAEQRSLERCIAMTKRATGERPLGFFCRGSQSLHTRGLLSDLGFEYDSNAFDDDLPYYDRNLPGAPMLILPYALDSNDMKFFHPNGFAEPGEFVRYIESALDVLIAEGERGTPKLLNIGLHLRISGRPARFAAVEGILDLLDRRGNKVWVARRLDIARHWRAHNPP